MAGLGQLFQAVFGVLPKPLAVPLAILVGLWLLRGFVFRTRVRQVRGLVRRLVRADLGEHARLSEEALSRAGASVHLLGELAREAHRRGQRTLFEEATRRLEASSEGRTELARVRRLEGLERPAPDIHAHVARISGLVDEGLLGPAEERLAEAEARHPGDPLLADLRRRLDAVVPGSAERIG